VAGTPGVSRTTCLASADPPVLHRKEALLHRKHWLYAKFARLTAQEEKHGLLADPSGIGTRRGWQARLQGAGYTLRGHRLVRQAGTPPAENAKGSAS
jgi:hypothetical protein